MEDDHEVGVRANVLGNETESHGEHERTRVGDGQSLHVWYQGDRGSCECELILVEHELQPVRSWEQGTDRKDSSDCLADGEILSLRPRPWQYLPRPKVWATINEIVSRSKFELKDPEKLVMYDCSQIIAKNHRRGGGDVHHLRMISPP